MDGISYLLSPYPPLKISDYKRTHQRQFTHFFKLKRKGDKKNKERIKSFTSPLHRWTLFLLTNLSLASSSLQNFQTLLSFPIKLHCTSDQPVVENPIIPSSSLLSKANKKHKAHCKKPSKTLKTRNRMERSARSLEAGHLKVVQAWSTC